MRDLSADELTRLRAFASETMQDECVILRRARTYSEAHGEPVVSYNADDAAVACGFEPVGQQERWREVVTVTDVEAHLRLPHGTAIDASCRVRVTKRHGQDATAQEFDVVSEPRVGPSGIVCDLKRVQL